MEASKRIKQHGSTPFEQEYIRADLVAKLKGYAVHKPDCEMVRQPFKLPFAYCTCGLTEVLKEMGG